MTQVVLYKNIQSSDIVKYQLSFNSAAEPFVKLVDDGETNMSPLFGSVPLLTQQQLTDGLVIDPVVFEQPDTSPTTTGTDYLDQYDNAINATINATGYNGTYGAVYGFSVGVDKNKLRSVVLNLRKTNLSEYSNTISSGSFYTNDIPNIDKETYTAKLFAATQPDLGLNYRSLSAFNNAVDVSSFVTGLNTTSSWNQNTDLLIPVQPVPTQSGLSRLEITSVDITYFASEPQAPLNVQASGGDGLASLSWNQPSDNGGDNVSGYMVQYVDVTDTSNSVYSWNTFPNNVSDTGLIVGNLVNDRSYIFRIAAINRVGTGPFSDESNIIITEEPVIVTPSHFNDANYTRIRIRRDTSTNWTGVNPTLALGEAAYETDTRLLKIGDNSTPWNNLDYVKVDNDSINFPAPSAITLTIGNSSVNADTPQVSCNLSNAEKLNLVGENGIDVAYNNSFKSVVFSMDKTFSPFTTGTLHSPSTRGTAGNVYYDNKYVYMCVDLNSWKRIPLPKTKWFSADGLEISNNSGLYASVTDIYFSGSNIIITSDGDPYPAKAGSTLVNDGISPRSAFYNNFYIADQEYNFILQYRGDTNTSAPEPANTGYNGVFTNGVIFSSPGASGEAIGIYTAPTGFTYNRSFFSSFFQMDDCGGHVNSDRKYAYYNGKFITRCWDDPKVYNANPYYSGTNFNGDYYRNTDGHSKIVGFCFDGYPIYGPFGYTDSENTDNSISLMTSSYVAKTGDNHRPSGWKYHNAIGVNDIAYNLTGGAFVEDFDYMEGSGILDQYNGRYAVTPEYPQGTYAYYLTFTNSGLLVPQYPYIIGNHSKQNKVNQTLAPSILPLTVDGYFPVFADAQAAANYGLLNGGDGTYHAHTILGQLYYMPNGVSFVHPVAPTDLSLSSLGISENATLNAVVGTFTTTDGNDGDIFTYTLVDGDASTDNANFAIVNNELRVNTVLSRNVQATHNIRVRTTDQTDRFFEKAFTINVVEATTFTSLSITSGISTLIGGSGHIFGSTVAGTANDIEYAWSFIGSPYISAVDSNTESTYAITSTNVNQRNDETVNVYLTARSVSAFATLTATTSFVLDHTEDPICVEGYYPLYASENDAIRDPNGNGTAHMHTVLGVFYWMPNGLSEYYHGSYDCDSLTPSKTEVCLDGSINVTIANTGDGNRYVFDANSSNTHKFKATTGTYVFNNVPASHPIAFHNHQRSMTYSGDTLAGNKTGLDGNNYNFYYGNVTGVFTGDFGTTSYECYYHGYMGGQNNIVYDGSCTSPTPTLTSTSIQSLDSVTGGSSLTLTASKVGTATDVVYSWSISSATGATLSSGSGQTVNLNTTDLDTDTDQTVTVTLTATSSSASATVSSTKTITIVQSSDSSPPTLTGVTISSNATVNGGSSVTLTAIPTGTATDVTYSWQVTTATGVSLSSSGGSSVTLNTTDLDTDTDQSVTVTVTASSVSASATVNDTQTITIYQSADGGGGGGGGGDY